MEHRDVRQLAAAFVSDQLTVDSAAAVVAHLERCPACRAEIEDLRRLRTATRAAFERDAHLAARPEFASELTARLRIEAERQPSRISRRTWLSMAAGAVLAVGAGWRWREWAQAGLTELSRLAVGDHRFCALTFRLAEKPISLAEAARRFGRMYAQLQDVEPSTPAVSGGPLRIVDRHSCVYEGRRFAHLVVRYKGEAISFLITPDRSRAPWGPGTIPVLLPPSEGFHVAAVHDGNYAVFAVSSLADADVQEVAQAMAAPIAEALANV